MKTLSNKLNLYMLCSALLLLQTPLYAAKKLNYTKVTDLTNKFNMPGISFLPPQESGWHYSWVHPGRILFAKIGTQTTQSFTGMVVLSKLPDTSSEQEFLEVIKKMRMRDVENPRFKDLLNEHSLTKEKGTLGVRFHLKYRDYGSKYIPKSTKYLVVEDFGVIYQHPNNRNVAITIALSQRFKEGESVESFDKLVDKFIKTAEFKPFKNSKSKK